MKSLVFLIVLAACTHNLKVEPVTVQPIHVTVDVNVHDSRPAGQKR